MLEDYGYNQETIDTIVDSDKPENLVGPFNSVKDLMKDLRSWDRLSALENLKSIIKEWYLHLGMKMLKLKKMNLNIS